VSGEIQHARTWRVGTWNVHGLRGGVSAAAQVIRNEEVDVLLVQESGPRHRIRALRERLGWIACADPPAFPRRRVQNAVLIRASLADSIRSHLVRFGGGSPIHPRGVLLAEVDEAWTVASVHLGLRGTERGRHIAELATLLEGPAGRFLLGGDLNVLPGEPGPSRLAEFATDCWEAAGEGPGRTFPSDEPSARIDYLFAGPAARPLRAWTCGGTVSDHLMVVAEIALDR
jgi:endonuclease/exonuclease/phosphatase family metal-dependent hydrolase